MLLGILAALRANINPHLVQFDSFPALLHLQQMNRLTPEHAQHRPRLSMDRHPLPANHRRIHTTHGRHKDEPLVINMHHHESNLIAMPRDHHTERRLRINHANHVAMHIRAHLIAEGFHLPLDGPLNSPFKSRWAGCLDKFLQKFKRFFLHDSFPLQPPHPYIAGEYEPQRNQGITTQKIVNPANYASSPPEPRTLNPPPFTIPNS